MRKQTLYFLTIAVLFFGANIFISNVLSQTKPFTMGQILRAIVEINERSGTVKKRTYFKVLNGIRQRKVDFPLTKENEELLRNEGATSELIEVIRKNSPPLRVPTPTLVPASTPVSIPAADSEKPEIHPNLPSMGGDYAITIEIPGQPLAGSLFLTQQGEVLTGNVKTMFGEDPIKDGKVTTDGFNFKVFAEFQGQGFELSVKGKVAGNSINGTIESAQGSPIPFSGTKNSTKDEPPAMSSIQTQLPKPVYLTYLEAGDRYFEELNFDQAIEEYNKVLELEPQNIKVLFQRGYAYHYKGDERRAIDDYVSAIRINPGLSNEPYLKCLAQVNFYGNFNDFVIENCSILIYSSPNIAIYYFKRGLAYQNKKDYTKALVDFNKAIELNRNFLLAYRNRAFVYDKLGQKKLAELDRKKVNELEKRNKTLSPLL